MKRIALISSFFFIFSSFSFADEETIGSIDIQERGDAKASENSVASDSSGSDPAFSVGENQESIELDPKTGFPKITEKPFLIFNEGIAYSQITRIVKQKEYDRSNFVYQNHLIGLSFEARSVNMKPVDSMLRLGVYYPFSHGFNGMKQVAKQTILYAFDLYWGPFFQTDMWKYVFINFSFGPHFLYELSDEFHHVELGGAVLLGAELPLAARWTIVTNALASLDYGNLGSNRRIYPYSLVYNYQIGLGVRYSKKKTHEYSYLAKFFNKKDNEE